MAAKDRPTTPDLIYEVLRSAPQPLTVDEILAEVNRRQPITTRDPKATIRSALQGGRQLVNTGDGRYGYLPRLVNGCVIRLDLTEDEPAQHPLICSDELQLALWPAFFEVQKRRNLRPVAMRLPGGDEIILPLTFLGPGLWGSELPPALRDYLLQHRAAVGDSLLIQVLDAEEGHAAAWLESRAERDEPEVHRRNQEVADAVARLLRRNAQRETMIWELIPLLLAQGVYRIGTAPDPLIAVLASDPRFVDAGLGMWILTESVTPAMRAEIELRKHFPLPLSERQQAPSLAEPPSAEPLPHKVPRHTAEQTLSDLQALLSKQQFDSTEDIKAFLSDIVAKGNPLPHRAETALERAQDIIYDAWETTSSAEQVRLAKKALQLSPDCADAYVILAEKSAHSLEEAAALLVEGVAAGERAQGKDAFEKYAGSFWGFIETRPYMRARLALAQVLWRLGRRPEAMEHAHALLSLNPGDNQGVRYQLLGWSLQISNNRRIKELLESYPNDGAAAWLYGRALYAFRTERDSRRSRLVLARARSTNRYVTDYFLRRKPMPDTLPDVMTYGGEDEAIIVASEQGAAWRNTPGALRWLSARAGSSGAH